jgi:hypothetical protein
LVLRALRHLAGADPEDTRTMVRLDLATLTTSTHPYLPRPQAVPLRAPGPPDGPEIDERAFSRAAAACVDPYTGILTAVEERHFQQLPLWVTEARLADPDGALAALGVPLAVHGAALDFPTARYRAARHALEWYAWAAADGGPLRGFRVDGGRPHPVRVDVVRATHRPPGWLPAGVASGPTWAAAVETALLHRCAAVAVAEAPSAHPVEVDAVPLDEVGQRLRGILRVAGAPVRAYDLTGPLGLPTYAVYLGDRPVAQVSGWTAAGALRDGLELVTLAYQAEASGEPEYDPPPVPALSVHSGQTRAVPADADPAGLIRALAERGVTPVAVPLDHDPVLNPVLPYAVQVVLV